MKPKKLSKRIRRLEARLQKGAKKLAKLKQKLEAVPITGVGKTKGKLAARAGEARQSVEASTRTQKNEGRLTAKPQVKPADVSWQHFVHSHPERRAQLVAAMKARWAAKRADANPQNSSADPGLAPGDLSQPR